MSDLVEAVEMAIRTAIWGSDYGTAFRPKATNAAARAALAAIEQAGWAVAPVNALDAEPDACAKIASDAEAWCRSFGAEETAERIAVEILARKDKRK